jgi:S-adenosylmethionine:tRNA ribosyltransferase-isomerase
MKTDMFDYHLPEELIAQTPVAKRDTSRLLVYDRNTKEITHKHFSDIIEYLNPGDTLVINDTKVLPARLFGKRADTGGKLEALLLKRVEGDVWEALTRPARKAIIGREFIFSDKLKMRVVGEFDDGIRHMELIYDGILEEILDEIGLMPLPPYIHEKLQDKSRYQTVYARLTGSAAAPTAGLHFTSELMDKVKAKGVNIAKVLLHVGLGTFRPVSVDDVSTHKMHSEYYEVTQETANLLNATRSSGGRIICVGTTSVRTLETATDDIGIIHSGSGETDIFIYPGYKFKACDALITNFHLPKSTLLMLVSALSSREEILEIYNIAVKEKYRFFSFGDAMFIK